MKMPSITNKQRNGFSTTATAPNGLDDEIGRDCYQTKLANKKLDMMMEQQTTPIHNGKPKEAEVFHDTSALGAHSNNKPTMPGQDDEPIVIYDTQSNTSIAQTAKDQFAAALLRLQSGLDDSSSRLNVIETKVDDIIRQQRQQQTRTQQATNSNNTNTWLSFRPKNDHLNTLIYLSWPVLVFVAMRALEKRAILKKVDV